MITVYDANTTLEDLRQIPLERPAGAGRDWCGTQHGDFVDAIRDEILCRGWKPGAMQFSVDRGGAALVGAIEMSGVGDVLAPEGCTLAVGFMTSNDRRKAHRLFVGGHVQVCHNGITTGTVVLSQKHTHTLDLAEEIETGFDRYIVAAVGMSDMVAQMRDTTMTTNKAVQLLDDAGKAKLMPLRRLWETLYEYHNPRHPEHGVPENGVGTAWGLYNAFTQVAKQNPPNVQMLQMEGFRNAVLAV